MLKYTRHVGIVKIFLLTVEICRKLVSKSCGFFRWKFHFLYYEFDPFCNVWHRNFIINSVLLHDRIMYNGYLVSKYVICVKSERVKKCANAGVLITGKPQNGVYLFTKNHTVYVNKVIMFVGTVYECFNVNCRFMSHGQWSCRNFGGWWTCSCFCAVSWCNYIISFLSFYWKFLHYSVIAS